MSSLHTNRIIFDLELVILEPIDRNLMQFTQFHPTLFALFQSTNEFYIIQLQSFYYSSAFANERGKTMNYILSCLAIHFHDQS